MAAPTLSSAEIINNEHTGTAQAGSTTSITLAAGASAVDDFYKGCPIPILSGQAKYNMRPCTGYDGGTKVASVAPDWDSHNDPDATAVPDNTSGYRVRSGHTLKVVWSEATNYQDETTNTVTGDAFADSDSTLIQNHTPDTDTEGGGWLSGDSLAPNASSSYGLQIVSNEARARVNAADNYAAIDVGLNLSLQVSATLSHGSSTTSPVGLVFRGNSDFSERMEVRFTRNGSTVELLKDGVQVESDSYAQGASISAKIVISGSSITVYDGATLVVEWTDSSYNDASHQYCGIYLSRTTQHTSDDFDVSEVIAAKVLTVTGAALFGHGGNREIAVSGIEWGDGTDTHYYTLPPGKPVNAGETVTCDMEEGFVKNGSSEDSAAISDQSVTNNSQQDAAPAVNLHYPMNRVIESGTTTISVEVEAYGFFGSGTGVSQVTVTADDGSNTVTTDPVTSRSESPHDGIRRYLVDVDLSTLDAGEVTLHATATSNCGLGTRDSNDVTILFDKAGALSSTTLYCAPINGDDANDGLTEGNPIKTFVEASVIGNTNSDDYLKVILIEGGDYPYAADQSPGVRFGGVFWVVPKDGLGKTDCYLTGDSTATNTDKADYVNSATGSLFIENCTVWLNNNEDHSSAPQRECYQYAGSFDTAIYNGAIECGTSVSQKAGTSITLGENLHLFNVTSSGVVSGRGVLSAFNWTGDAIEGDMLSGGIASNVQFNRRGGGEPAFTVSCTHGNPKAEKNASLEFVLTDDSNGTTTIDLTDAGSDTLSELISTINAVDGWTATRLLTDPTWDDYVVDHDGVQVSGIDTFAELDVPGGGLTIYVCTEQHTDQCHLIGGDPSNVIMAHIDAPVASGAERPGAHDGAQVYNFAGGDIQAFVVINCSTAQWADLTSTPRSMLRSNCQNFLIAFTTITDRSTNLDYDSASSLLQSYLQPANYVITYCVFEALVGEGDPMWGHQAGSDIYLDDCHYATSSTIDALYDSNATIGSLDSEFESYTSGTDNSDTANVDLSPAAESTFLNRLPAISWQGMGDQIGTLLPTDGTGAIGALQAAASGGGAGADGTVFLMLMGVPL